MLYYPLIFRTHGGEFSPLHQWIAEEIPRKNYSAHYVLKVKKDTIMKNEQIREKHSHRDVKDALEWAASTYGEKIVYSFKASPTAKEVERVSFVAFRDEVRALTCEFLSMGIKGKHCVLIARSSYQWSLAYYATLIAGGVLVPLDREWRKEDLADTAEKADAAFLFIDEELSDKEASIRERCKLTGQTVHLNGEGENSLLSLLEAGKKKFNDDPALYFENECDPNAMALLVFTSGTTGKGKGVMLSQKAIVTDIDEAAPFIDFTDKALNVLPPHHTYGSTIMTLGHVMIGCEVYFSDGLRYIQKELKEQKPRHLVLVPLYLETFYRKIWTNIKEQGKEKLVRRMLKISNALRKIGIDLRGKLFAEIRAAFGGEVRMIVSGGAPINPEIIDFYDAIGISTLNGYGITECAPLIAVNRSRNIVKGSVGKPLDCVTVKIADPNEDGEGEICVKGPNVMLGYYKDEAATREAFDGEGYFKTGDYGKIDKNGMIYITGRKKNLIILSNGKNVYPEEIENELIATPGVLDIIVYEGQSRRGIEHNAIVAEIYPDKDHMEKNGITDIKEYLQPAVDEYNRTAVPYKKIGVLKVREEEFPKNTLRKIMRFKLDMTID